MSIRTFIPKINIILQYNKMEKKFLDSNINTVKAPYSRFLHSRFHYSRIEKCDPIPTFAV